MTDTWQSVWSWRARTVWALLGPALVLTVEVESLLVILNGFGQIKTGPELHGWPALIAGLVLILLIAAQVSLVLRGNLSAARRGLAERRRALEEEKLGGTRSGYIDSDHRRFPFPAIRLPMSRLRESKLKDNDIERVVGRFGLEPSWAFQQLDEDLHVPAARRLSREAQLANSRWAGHATACLLAILLPGVAIQLIGAPEQQVSTTGAVVLTALLLFIFMGQLFSTMRVGNEVVAQETRFYRKVEALLEMHRFELYRALALPLPSDAEEERDGGLAAWRLGSGNISFDRPDDRAGGDSRAGFGEPIGLGQLVPYEGFVSWTTGDTNVELAFGRAPVLDGGHAQLQVGGTDKASHAPFDITADSTGLDLLQVRASVQVPVDGRTVRRTFNFTRTADTGPKPELWLEISQRGRFVQLLRVLAPQGLGR